MPFDDIPLRLPCIECVTYAICQSRYNHLMGGQQLNRTTFLIEMLSKCSLAYEHLHTANGLGVDIVHSRVLCFWSYFDERRAS